MKIFFNQFNKPPFINAKSVKDYFLVWYHKDAKKLGVVIYIDIRKVGSIGIYSGK